MARARLSSRVDLASGLRIGPEKISLLETKPSTGPISAAACSLEMSYRRAWLLVEEINRGLHEPAVTAESGVTAGERLSRQSVSASSIDLHHSVESQTRSGADNAFRALGALARRERASMTSNR
jgi:molybdate transport system regulatory protein